MISIHILTRNLREMHLNLLSGGGICLEMKIDFEVTSFVLGMDIDLFMFLLLVFMLDSLS